MHNPHVYRVGSKALWSVSPIRIRDLCKKQGFKPRFTSIPGAKKREI